MRKIFQLAFLICALSALAQAQFNSGSTGADGALDLLTMNCPNNVCAVQLPESGILNYTTVNIPTGKWLQFLANSRNTPVILLVQGNVFIGGEINVSAPCTFGLTIVPCRTGRQPGPGGFYGGSIGRRGFGPGGGSVPCDSPESSGRWVGALNLVPIIGGSGGAGCFNGEIEGGGGGAITIASSTLISLTGSVMALGRGIQSTCGSGGAIRLVANSLNISGNLNAHCNGTHFGAIRLEAPEGQRTFTGTATPAAVLAPVNPNIVSNNQPQLTIASVGGYAVPSYAGSRFDTVDLLLPNQIPDPVNVAVNANNIPVGTQINVGFVSGSPNGTTAPCNLAGIFSSSSCTATISNLNRTGVTYLLATAAFAPPAPLAQYNPKGKDQVAAVRLETILGKPPKYVFLRSDKTTIDAAKVSKEILQYFGM